MRWENLRRVFGGQGDRSLDEVKKIEPRPLTEREVAGCGISCGRMTNGEMPMSAGLKLLPRDRRGGVQPDP